MKMHYMHTILKIFQQISFLNIFGPTFITDCYHVFDSTVTIINFKIWLQLQYFHGNFDLHMYMIFVFFFTLKF